MNLPAGKVYIKMESYFLSFMHISCRYKIIIWPEYVINFVQVKREKSQLCFMAGFLSSDVSVKLITNAVSCRSMSMGLEDISCSS